MARYLISIFALCLAGMASAQQESVSDTFSEASADSVAEPPAEEIAPDLPELRIVDAAEVTLDDFLWQNRLIVVFADTPADPRFQEQIDLLNAWPDALIEREVVVIVDTDPSARTSVRLKLRPRGFQLALLAKDGKVNLRKPFAWDVREITHAIDKWPLRQQELRSGG